MLLFAYYTVCLVLSTAINYLLCVKLIYSNLDLFPPASGCDSEIADGVDRFNLFDGRSGFDN